MILYPEFAEFVAEACRALDELAPSGDTGAYTGKCEVYLDGEIVGYLVDEGVGYAYMDSDIVATFPKKEGDLGA